jgi:Phospholipase_D-nuclease N-terminal
LSQGRSGDGQTEALERPEQTTAAGDHRGRCRQTLLAAAALLDLRRRPSEQVRGSKRLWAVATLVNFVGPLAYFAFGRRRG